MALVLYTQKGIEYFNNAHIKRAVLIEQFDLLQVFMVDGQVFLISKLNNKKIGNHINDVSYFDTSESETISNLFFSCIR